MGGSQGIQEKNQVVTSVRSNTQSSYDVKDFKDLYTKG
jgi:hypothetical protein